MCGILVPYQETVLIPGTLVVGNKNECVTHILHSIHVVPVSVSTSHAATQYVEHPRTIASARDTRYQVKNK